MKYEHIICDQITEDGYPIYNDLLKKQTQLPHKVLNHTHFVNGSICEYKGITLYAYRTQQEPHFIHTLCHLTVLKNGKLPMGEQFTFKPRPPCSDSELLNYKMIVKSNPTYDLWRAEDPRLVVHEDSLYMFFTTGWKMGYCKIDLMFDGSEIVSCVFNPAIYPDPPDVNFDGYDGREKNWSPVSYEGELWVLYACQPNICFYRLSDGRILYAKAPLVDTWKYGNIKGGTPLMKMDNGNFLTIFHSTMRVDGGAYIYTAGAMVFNPDLHLIGISKHPLIAPNLTQDKRSYLQDVAVVFPAGLVRKGNKWLVSCGINDWCTRIFTITDSTLNKNITYN